MGGGGREEAMSSTSSQPTRNFSFPLVSTDIHPQCQELGLNLRDLTRADVTVDSLSNKLKILC